MAQKMEDPLEVIKAEIETKFNAAIIDMAAETTFLIEAAYESVVQSFYDDYTPRVYQRTYSTYLGSDRYNDPFGFTPVGDDAYEAGINVDPANIPGNPYRAKKEWVFPRTFEEGIHGFFAWEYARWAKERYRALNRKYVMSSARKNRLKELFRKTYKHSPRKFVGKKTTKTITTSAMKGNMKTSASDIDYWADFVENSEKGEKKELQVTVSAAGWNHMTPKRYMDREFREITKKSNMDKRFNNILEKYFM